MTSSEAPKRAGAAGDSSSSLARRVIGGTGVIALAGVVNKLFSLVSAPILTKVLGPAPYGVSALAATVTSLASTVALMGIDVSYARFFFAGGPGEGAAVERFCWRRSLVAACTLALLAAAAWIAASGRAGLPPALSIMVALGVLLAAVNTMAGTRTRLRGAYGRIAAAIVVAGGAGAALTIALALLWRRDAWSLLVGAAGGVALGTVVAGLPGAGTLRPSGLPRGVRREVVRLGLAGAVTAPMYWLMNSADRWFLALWRGGGETGVYSFAAGVGLLGGMLNSAVTLTWFPEVSRAYEESSGRGSAPAEIGRLWARLAAALLVAWIAVTAAGGDVLRLVADPRFHGGAAYIPWLAGGVLFYGVASLANTGLVLSKTMAPAAAWWIAGAACNIALNALLVRGFGGLGASIAACASFALVAGGTMASAQRRLRLAVPWGRLAAAAVAALAAGVATAGPWSANPLASLAAKFPVGVAAAAGVTAIVAPDWLARLAKGELFRRPPGPGGTL